MSVLEWVAFEELVARLRRERPVWFDFDSDRIATVQDVEAMQADLGAELPQPYVQFLMSYGGGPLVFAWVYSADPDGDYFYRDRKEPGLPRDLVAFSDDGTGCLYVFPVTDGKCEDRVLIWDGETREVRNTEIVGFVDFLAKVALRQD